MPLFWGEGTSESSRVLSVLCWDVWEGKEMDWRHEWIEGILMAKARNKVIKKMIQMISKHMHENTVKGVGTNVVEAFTP